MRAGSILALFLIFSVARASFIRKPDAQHADENDNWLRILYNLTVSEDARSFERIDHRTDSDSDASTDFKIFAASLFRGSTRERCALSTRDLVLKIAAHAKEMAQAPIWEI